MKLVAVLDSTAFESLPEKIDPRELFKKNEKEDNYVLDIDGVEAGKLAIPLQADIEKLKKHNETVLGEKDALQVKIKAYEELGKTPEELTAIINDKTPQDVAAITEAHKLEMKSLTESSQQAV